MTTVVIKYGGHAMDRADLSERFADDLAFFAARGARLVVVHGGGPQITSLLTRLGIESRFVDGLRVTDAPTMEAVEMALAGQINKAVVSALARKNVRAVGVSGRDGRLLVAEVKNAALGRVGDVTAVDTSMLDCLLDAGFVPIVAPIASSTDNEALNVNADTAAGAIAGALRADFFVLISDVPGVLDAEGELIPALDRKMIAKLRQEGVINGGMIPKTRACLNALDCGCARALILDGRAPSSLKRYLLDNEPLGTVIKSDMRSCV
ncbi:MAG: acetylglutamate kinase [Desulfovibrio sp.]|nr:acetylglutamate kinase [Desulfovibrio sp.]